MNVLSLFDGISCGQVALHRAGVDPFFYLASEIDKDAIAVTQHNFPDTEQLGDIRSFSLKGSDIDLVIGGSPCQGFSFVGKRLNFDDERSKLFFEYVRHLEELCPKYFLFENVKMRKESEDIITKYLGVDPVEVDSAVVSAQSRKRLYWTNIPFEIPEDRGISISDVIGVPCKGAASRARYINGVSGKTAQKIEVRKDDKANAMTTVSKNCMIVEDSNSGIARYLTQHEAEKMMTLPVGYTKVVPKYKAHKLLGNAWTVDVIACIFKGLEEK